MIFLFEIEELIVDYMYFIAFYFESPRENWENNIILQTSLDKNYETVSAI